MSGNREFHGNLSLRFDRRSRSVVRLKTPLLYRFTRGGKKNLWATDWLELLDIPLFVDRCQQHHCTLHRLLFSQHRICRGAPSIQIRSATKVWSFLMGAKVKG